MGSGHLIHKIRQNILLRPEISVIGNFYHSPFASRERNEREDAGTAANATDLVLMVWQSRWWCTLVYVGKNATNIRAACEKFLAV